MNAKIQAAEDEFDHIMASLARAARDQMLCAAVDVCEAVVLCNGTAQQCVNSLKSFQERLAVSDAVRDGEGMSRQ